MQALNIIQIISNAIINAGFGANTDSLDSRDPFEVNAYDEIIYHEDDKKDIH